MSKIQSSFSQSGLSNMVVSASVVLDALARLKRNKSDGSSNHLILASPAISVFLSSLFTAILCHGNMPRYLRYCTLVPIPKSYKDPSTTLSPWLQTKQFWSGALRFIMACFCACTCSLVLREASKRTSHSAAACLCYSKKYYYQTLQKSY